MTCVYPASTLGPYSLSGYLQGSQHLEWQALRFTSCPASYQLLQKSPEKRLGAGERDAEEIKVQPFFRVSS